MTRVLHVIDSLGGGGAESQLTSMLAASDKRRFLHTVCALGVADRYGARLRAAGIRFVKFNAIPRREPLKTLGALRSLVREVEPDVIHTSLYWSSILGRVAARLARSPVVTTLVNTSYEPEWRMDNPRLTPAKHFAVRLVDAATARRWNAWFVALTESIRLSAIRQLGLPPERISVIPRGLDTDRFAHPPAERVEAARLDLGWDGAYPVLLNVGRLVPQKGQRYIVSAMPEILKTFPRALLVLAGEGYLRADLEALARSLGVADHLRLLGARDDVPLLLAAADLFVFPSLYEGFGTALLEALTAGCPCVASRVPAVSEVTEGGTIARLVTPQSPTALAEAVMRLAGDRLEAARLGDEAAIWTRGRYHIIRSTRMFETVFEAVASGRPVRLEEAVGAIA